MTDIRAALEDAIKTIVVMHGGHYGCDPEKCFAMQSLRQYRAALAAASPEPERCDFDCDACRAYIDPETEGDAVLPGHPRPAPAAPSAEARGDRGHRYDAEGHCIEQGCPYHIPAAPSAEALRDALLGLVVSWSAKAAALRILRSERHIGEAIGLANAAYDLDHYLQKEAAARADERTRLSGITHHEGAGCEDHP